MRKSLLLIGGTLILIHPGLTFMDFQKINVVTGIHYVIRLVEIHVQITILLQIIIIKIGIIIFGILPKICHIQVVHFVSLLLAPQTVIWMVATSIVEIF